MGIIAVSGLPGSGTSTTCSLLQERLGWRYVNAGQIFRQLAMEEGISLAGLGRRAEADASIDRRLDERMVEIARQEAQVILEGRLTGWMVLRHGMAGLKVWCQAPIEIRAARVSRRERQSLARARREIAQRGHSESQRYARHHQIDLGDLSIYDLVIDTAARSPEEVVGEIIAALQPEGER